MSVPRWIAALVRRLAPADRAEDLLGDLEEVHRRRVARGRWRASLHTAFEAVELGVSLWHERRRGRRRAIIAGFSLLDFRLAMRLLLRYPGLTIVGGLAMAFAIWVSAGSSSW